MSLFICSCGNFREVSYTAGLRWAGGQCRAVEGLRGIGPIQKLDQAQQVLRVHAVRRLLAAVDVAASQVRRLIGAAVVESLDQEQQVLRADGGVHVRVAGQNEVAQLVSQVGAGDQEGRTLVGRRRGRQTDLIRAYAASGATDIGGGTSQVRRPKPAWVPAVRSNPQRCRYGCPTLKRGASQ